MTKTRTNSSNRIDDGQLLINCSGYNYFCIYMEFQVHVCKKSDDVAVGPMLIIGKFSEEIVNTNVNSRNNKGVIDN